MNIAEEIKERIDVVSAISDYVQLEKAGRSFRGLCPFHVEKTPSFFVFPERQSWRCFGCGAGGDLITFVMKKEGLEFGEALKVLAPKAGMVLHEKKPSAPENRATEKLYAINEAAAQYYHHLLLSAPTAQMAREYVEKRGLNHETVADFRLGFSLDEWDGLKHHLNKQGYRVEDLLSAGLVIAKERQTYDRFRGRLMFPICNAKGQVVGFGARALDNAMPKYLNSAESPIFNKSKILYGIDRAKAAIQEQGKAVIVEGYMDAITAHQNGFSNVLASMGTALTEKQIAMLRGLATHVLLALDPDAAGNAATIRGIEICRQVLDRGKRETPNWLAGTSELNTKISIISLPSDQDPDELIRQNPKGWQRMVDEAQPLMDYLFTIVADKFDLSRTEGKSQVSEKLLPLIAEMKDSIEREVYLNKLSRLVGISERTLAGIAARLHRTKSSKSRKREAETCRPISQTSDQLETYCLSLLLKNPSLENMVGKLLPDHFEHSENREVFIAWRSTREIDAIRDNLDVALHDYVDALVTMLQPPLDKRGLEQAIDDCISRMEERRLRYQLVFEAESALEAHEPLQESSMRLAELQRRRATLGR